MLQLEVENETIADAVSSLDTDGIETLGDTITGRLIDDDLNAWLRGVYAGLADDELDRAKSLLQSEIDARNEFERVDEAAAES